MLDNSIFKFRVLDKEHNKFSTGLMDSCNYIMKCFFDGSASLILDVINKDRFKLTQFTGLYDCYGYRYGDGYGDGDGDV